MKNLLKSLIIILITFIILYLTGSFIVRSFDTIYWNSEGRVITTSMSLLSGIIYLIFKYLE